MHTKVKREVQEMERAHLEREIAQIRRTSVWRSVEVGTYSVTELISQLERLGCVVTGRVRTFILPHVRIETKPRIVQLVDVRTQDLEAGANLRPLRVYQAARRWGLRLSTPEVGLHVMLRMCGEPEHKWDEWLRIAMNPIRTVDGEGKESESVLFPNRNEHGIFYLGVIEAGPRVVWGDNRRIIFELPD